MVGDVNGRNAGSSHFLDVIVSELPEFAPAGWRRLEAWFAVTVVCESAVLLADDGARTVRCTVSESVWDAVRRHRLESAAADAGPWWRLLVRLDAGGVETGYDYGAEPFPGEQLFAPEAYIADLDHYPRKRLPVWLAAYIGRGVAQSRPPRRAAAAARADDRAGVHAVPADGELPDLGMLWARWGVLAAAFAAVGSELGPRVSPSVGVFEGARRSGSTLTVLPGDRAVLSGGVWGAPILEAVYNGGAEFPKLFAGAPEWVADPVLNPRVATGMLTFCYWWVGGRWYSGESAAMAECAPAVPAVWTVETVRDVVVGLIGERSDAASAEELVLAAESRSVTRKTIERVFGHHDRIDSDGALFQFTVAGLVSEQSPAAVTGASAVISEAEAIDLVRQHIDRQGYDTTGYQLSTLRADRMSTVWVVHSPPADDETRLDRAVFYVAEDGEVEHSTSSVPWSEFARGVQERSRRRRAGRG